MNKNNLASPPCLTFCILYRISLFIIDPFPSSAYVQNIDAFNELLNNSLWFYIYFFSQNFLVDIKGPALAFLPVLAFEGGTRRNIPKFEVGIVSKHEYFD